MFTLTLMLVIDGSSHLLFMALANVISLRNLFLGNAELVALSICLA